jgi:5'-3' exonuclease
VGLIVADMHSIIHASLHTPQSELKDSKGRFTGGVHGALSSLSKIVLKHQLKDQVIGGWDLGIPIFRRELYKEYKPHKIPIGNVSDSLKSADNLLAKEGDEARDDYIAKLVMTTRMLHSQILPLSGCLSIQVPNCEADDIIAYICSKLPNERVTIYSSDMDLVQLVTKNIDLYDSRTDTMYTVESLIRDNNLNKDCWRAHWLTIRAIAGDTSDNIPGFCGWETAEKYASQLIDLQHNKHYTLYDSLTKLERPTGARTSGYEALKNGHDILLRNFKLMDLRYPIDNKFSIVEDIRSEIATAFIFDINQDLLEEQLHKMDMRVAKTFVSNIIESNIRNDVKEYIRKLVA